MFRIIFVRKYSGNKSIRIHLRLNEIKIFISTIKMFVVGVVVLMDNVVSICSEMTLRNMFHS